MEGSHDILLLWIYIAGLCISSLLLVRPKEHIGNRALYDLINSMRYSRMLEESSFANRKADYFWLLLLSSVMLLVSLLDTLLWAVLTRFNVH